VAPDRLAQLLHRARCYTVHCGLQLKETSIGEASAGICQGHWKAVHADLLGGGWRVWGFGETHHRCEGDPAGCQARQQWAW
jgi:hypothetical protein